MALYHFEVGFPEGMHFRPVLGLVPTMHAQQARLDDPRGIITLPKAFLPGVAQVIEAETDSNGNIIKVLARQPHDSQNDVVYAFIPASRLIKRKTVALRAWPRCPFPCSEESEECLPTVISPSPNC